MATREKDSVRATQAARLAPSAVPATIPVDEGAEAFVEALVANGVEYIFLNPGTDTFPVQEAIAKLSRQGRAVPQVILSLHESQALASAHGYFMLTGKPQVVLVHVDLGTQNIGGALHNAQRGHAGVVICAGRAPMTFEGELRGTKNMSIHWIQEQYNQAGIVRDYVKWDYELRRPENIHHIVQRAFQVAGTEPTGPVYLTLPREVLMQKMESMPYLAPERYGPATSPQADPMGLRQAAEWLIAAERPVVLPAMMGRHASAVHSLVELAELLALPVVDARYRVNFPTEHDLHLGYNAAAYVKDADVILLVDNDIPYIPAMVRPLPTARIIQIDIDPIKQQIPLWGFPVDLPLLADSSKAIPALVNEVKRLITPADEVRFAERRQRLAAEHRRQRTEWEAVAESKANQTPIASEWLAHCIGQVIDDDTIVLNEAVGGSQFVAQYVKTEKPGVFFQSGGSSLGWCVGAQIGAKLAAPDKTIIAVSADGNFLFGEPIASLWAADMYKTPALTVIFNNQCYNAVKRNLRIAYPEGASVSENCWIGTDIAPPPSYELIAKACRAYGETVTEPGEIIPALKRGLAEVHKGRSAVIDVILELP